MDTKPPTVKEIASSPPSIFTIGHPVVSGGVCIPRIPSFVQQYRKPVREGGDGDNAGNSCHVTTGVDSGNPPADKARVLAKPPRLPSIPSHADIRFASSTDLVSVPSQVNDWYDKADLEYGMEYVNWIRLLVIGCNSNPKIVKFNLPWLFPFWLVIIKYLRIGVTISFQIRTVILI